MRLNDTANAIGYNVLVYSCSFYLPLPARPPSHASSSLFLHRTFPVSHLLSLTHTRVHAFSHVHISIRIRQRVRRVLCIHHIHQSCLCIHQWVMSLCTMSRVSIYNESRLYTHTTASTPSALYTSHTRVMSFYTSMSPYTLRPLMCMTSIVHTREITHSYDGIDWFICAPPLCAQWVRGVQATLLLEAIQEKVQPGRYSQKSACFWIYYITSL